MKKLFVIILLTTFLGVVGCSNVTIEVERTLTNEQWIEEIKHMVEATVKYHPNPFFATDKEVWMDSVDRLITDVPSLSEKHIQYRITQLLAELREGHVYYDFQDQSELFPLYLDYFGEDLRVIGATKEFEKLIDMKLIAINKTSLEELELKIDTLISHENKQWARAIRPHKIMTKDILEFLNVIDNKPVKFTFINEGGKEVSKTISSINFEEYYNDLVYIDKPNAPLRTQVPTDASPWYWYTYLDEEDTMYFQYNTCVGTDDAVFNAVKNEMLTLSTEKSGEMEKFIIDLRFNGGGYKEAFTSVASRLKKLQEQAPFDVYVLIGESTFSFATVAATDAQKYLNATLIGEETGGQSQFYAGVFPQELPYSKAIFVLSREYYNLGPNDGGLLPDIEVIQTYEDYSQGIDTVLEAALRH